MLDRALSGSGRGALLDRLRESTSDLHERVERVVPLLRPELDRAIYAGYLARLLGYYLPVEASIAAAPGWSAHGFDVGARRKAHLIERDLRALGAGEARIAAAPRCRALPDLSSLDRAVGGLYVLEGATLGARVLCRAIRALGLDERTGAAFLHGYGAATGAMWSRFGEALAAYAPAADAAAVISGARQTFTTLERWLGAPGAAEAS